jgi:hypothetical protein
MCFRFRRRLRIFSGLWVNLSKRGGSVGIGGRGATINLSPKGHKPTVGLPESGLSYRTRGRPIDKRAGHLGASRKPITTAHVVSAIIIALLILWALQHAH